MANEPETDARGSDPVARLSTFDRVLLLVLGWLLIILGVAGLALPLLQGVLFLVIGAAVLSLVNRTAFRFVRRVFRRWPKAWKRLLGWRRWIFDKLTGAGGQGHPVLHKAILLALVLAVLALPIVVLPLACGGEGKGAAEDRERTATTAPTPDG